MMTKNNESNSIPIEIFIARYFVKYKRLDQLVQFAFSGSSANSIDIFIDIYGIYRGIFSRSYISDISDYTSFTSSYIDIYSPLEKSVGDDDAVGSYSSPIKYNSLS